MNIAAAHCVFAGSERYAATRRMPVPGVGVGTSPPQICRHGPGAVRAAFP